MSLTGAEPGRKPADASAGGVAGPVPCTGTNGRTAAAPWRQLAEVVALGLWTTPWELTSQLEISVKHVKLGGAGCLVGLGHILQAMWWVEPTVLNRTSKAGTAAGSRSGQARSNTIKRAWVSSNK